MKILVIYKKKGGGVGTVIKYFVKWFTKRGHNIEVISREDDLKIYSCIKSIFPIRRLVKEHMEKKNFDIIFTNDWGSALPLLLPYPLFRKKHFCLYHGTQPGFNRILQIIVGKFLGKRLLVDLSKKYFPKATLFHERVDHEVFKPNKKIKIIKNSVGFASWPTDEYHFNESVNATKEAGKKFILAENISKDKMPEYYNKMESFISLPPSYAGFGLVNIEAMASGIPKIIGSNYGGGDLLPITKVEDFKSLTEAIKNAENKDYRKWIIENNFTWEEGVKELEEIFKGKSK